MSHVLIFLVAWFTFDPCLSSPELCFTPDNMTVTCEGFEHRVALGSVGFSRGVHFWEFTIDRFDADTDPSFGVARLDVSKEEMLGTYIGQYIRPIYRFISPSPINHSIVLLKVIKN